MILKEKKPHSNGSASGNSFYHHKNVDFMKWAKLVDATECYIQKETPVERLCYKYVNQRDLEKNFGVWAHYKFFPNFKITARSKKDYEHLVGGFLLFYDENKHSGVVD